MARRYRPSGRSPLGAVPLLLAGCLGAGVAMGVLEAVCGHYLVSVFLLFPALIGLSAGGFAWWGVGRLRVRAPALAAAMAFLGGAAGSLADHRTEYQLFRIEAARQLQGGDPAEAAAAIDAYLLEETGREGWEGFIRLQAKEGISVHHGGQRERAGIRFDGLGAYILWGVELLLAAIIAAYMAFRRAREPFCEHCQAWYDRELLLGLGSGDPRAWKAVAAALDHGDLAAALAARGEPEGDRRSLLRLRTCTRCRRHEPLLSLHVTTGMGTKKQKARTPYETLLRYDQAQVLLERTAGEREADAAALSAVLAGLGRGGRR